MPQGILDICRGIQFTVTKRGRTVPVRFFGLIPDGFDPGASGIVEECRLGIRDAAVQKTDERNDFVPAGSLYFPERAETGEYTVWGSWYRSCH